MLPWTGERGQADRLLSGLFPLALELRLTTGTLRAKIFVRPDMTDARQGRAGDLRVPAPDA
ncbi:hypothetical protein ACFYQA_16135 [Streptomyces sp. NPDC005774]|uniref:hypothetical protein n=1 Tax=Streptomyces sp. NPDC005774 TaxID=3364728 RepID=UPI00367E81B0